MIWSFIFIICCLFVSTLRLTIIVRVGAYSQHAAPKNLCCIQMSTRSLSVGDKTEWHEPESGPAGKNEAFNSRITMIFANILLKKNISWFVGFPHTQWMNAEMCYENIRGLPFKVSTVTLVLDAFPSDANKYRSGTSNYFKLLLLGTNDIEINVFTTRSNFNFILTENIFVHEKKSGWLSVWPALQSD